MKSTLWQVPVGPKYWRETFLLQKRVHKKLQNYDEKDLQKTKEKKIQKGTSFQIRLLFGRMSNTKLSLINFRWFLIKEVVTGNLKNYLKVENVAGILKALHSHPNWFFIRWSVFNPISFQLIYFKMIKKPGHSPSEIYSWRWKVRFLLSKCRLSFWFRLAISPRPGVLVSVPHRGTPQVQWHSGQSTISCVPLEFRFEWGQGCYRVHKFVLPKCTTGEGLVEFDQGPIS